MLCNSLIYRIFHSYVIFFLVTSVLLISGTVSSYNGGINNGQYQVLNNQVTQRLMQYSRPQSNGITTRPLEDDPKRLFKMFSKSLYTMFLKWINKYSTGGRKFTVRYIRQFFRWIKERIFRRRRKPTKTPINSTERKGNLNYENNNYDENFRNNQRNDVPMYGYNEIHQQGNINQQQLPNVRKKREVVPEITSGMLKDEVHFLNKEPKIVNNFKPLTQEESIEEQHEYV